MYNSVPKKHLHGQQKTKRSQSIIIINYLRFFLRALAIKNGCFFGAGPGIIFYKTEI